MAVISELIDAGLELKQQGNVQAAIEHFRQLSATYPQHPRIMFELAGAWRAFGVPERALPLYRKLVALPKNQGLPPKLMPRLYTQLGATLRLLGNFTESLTVVEEGLRLYPAYRPLRVYRMFALHSSGYHQNAMVDALALMLESLAPAKWDSFEDEILQIVGELRERIPAPDTAQLENWEFEEYWQDAPGESEPAADEAADEPAADAQTADAAPGEAAADEAVDAAAAAEPMADEPAAAASIAVTAEPPADSSGDFELEVKVIAPPPPKSKSRQFGSKPIQIRISGTPADSADDDDDDDAPPAGRTQIPIDFD